MSPPVFSHVTLGTSDLGRAMAFYDRVMGTIGLVRHSTGRTFAGYGHAVDARLGVNSLWILLPENQQPASFGNGTNIAFLARTRVMVQQFHDAALAGGGSDAGPPGLRPDVHPNFYAAYVRDLDGNKLAVVCHEDQGVD